MTIVVDCFAKEAAFQVSDRRLTDINSGTIVDDHSNKAVMVEGRVVFAYTGLASIDGLRTDLWLAQAIAEGPTKDFSAVADRVREKATAAFSKIRCPAQWKRHAFRGTGWFRLPSEDRLSPGLITIHNTYDDKTGNFLDNPLAEFKVSSYFPTESDFRGGCYIRNVGVTPSPAERAFITRLVRKCSKNRHATKGAVLHALIRSVQSLSTYRNYKTIGSNVMAICIPKASVESDSYTFERGNPQDDQPTFLYVNTEGYMSSAPFGPIFVRNGTMMMRQSELARLPRLQDPPAGTEQ